MLFALHNLIQRAGGQLHACPACQAPFVAHRKQRYCSLGCNQRMRNKRKEQWPGRRRGISPMTPWSRRKKDAAPRGVFRHRSSTRTVTIWAVRILCGGGHVHEERVGTVKTEAIRAHHERRARAGREPGWCPATERAAIRAQAARAITMAEYAD